MKMHVLIPAFAIALLFSNCNKPEQDYPQYCQILHIKNSSRFTFDDYTADFQYDSKGTPLRITRSFTATGAPSYMFRHDQHNRVTDVITYYSNSSDGEVFESWYRLKYDARNRVVLDSTFHFGIIGPNPSSFPDHAMLSQVFTYHYDAQNRIIKYTMVEGAYVHNRYFYYNNKGNLDSAVTKYTDGTRYKTEYSKYDNKVNIRRTNPLWQYLDRDYSVNNSYNTVTANKYGLPTSIGANSIKDNPQPFFVGFAVDNLDIQYSCK